MGTRLLLVIGVTGVGIGKAAAMAPHLTSLEPILHDSAMYEQSVDMQMT
jgi:hypothetical protein